MSKEPSYVRCIKPNEIKSPVQFNDERVAHQVSHLVLIMEGRVCNKETRERERESEREREREGEREGEGGSCAMC